MIHHLFPGRAEHHIPVMIQYFKSITPELHIGLADQVFVFYGATPEQFNRYVACLPPGNKTVAVGRGRLELFRYIKQIERGDSLILHSAFYPLIWLILLCFPRLWKRTGWVMWGADIYGKPTWRGRLYRLIKHLVIPRLGAVSALVPGDFNDLQRLIGTCPNYVRAFYSASYGANDHGAIPPDRAGGEGATRLVLGNSGWDQNDHILALRWLSRFADREIQVICPLGYPQHSAYKSEVIEAGRQLLGSRFHPIEGLLPWDEYHALLASCEILVLNCRNQQGLGNIYAMLLHGAKIFIRGDSSTFSMLKDFGFHVYDTRSIPMLSFGELTAFSKALASSNRALFGKYLSLEASIEGWKMLLAKIGTHNNNGEKPHDNSPVERSFGVGDRSSL